MEELKCLVAYDCCLRRVVDAPLSRGPAMPGCCIAKAAVPTSGVAARILSRLTVKPARSIVESVHDAGCAVRSSGLAPR